MTISYIRTIILYFSLITVIRLMGKRQLGQMEPSEFVVAMLIADLASVPMQDTGIPLLYGLVPILIILSLELMLSYLSFRHVRFRRIFCGKPVILMENGKILYSQLLKTRVSVNELIEHIRENGIVDLTEVRYAVLETNGTMSVLPRASAQPATAADAHIPVTETELPIALICDGSWQEENLTLSGKSKAWVTEKLQEQHCTVQDVLLMTIVPSGKIYLAKREETP